jgi:hypothetical protein
MADSDRRSTLLDSYENAVVIVSGIAADELGHPTPCPGYDVAALIDHLVEAGHRAPSVPPRTGRLGRPDGNGQRACRHFPGRPRRVMDSKTRETRSGCPGPWPAGHPAATHG